jgi:zinc/manganese transport system permease protein
MLRLIFPALIAGVIFSGMHVFAGLRLLDRAAAFTGLAITQFAALGLALSILTGHDEQGVISEVIALAFALIAAAMLPRVKANRETAAAVAFLVAAAATALVLNFTAGGLEQAKVILIGNITAVSLHILLRIAIVYVAAAILLGKSDFLLVAAAVAFSVPVIGVLPAFSYLIIPPVAAMMFRQRLALGWTTGALATAIGIVLSFKLDLPTGAGIVCTLGLTLLLMTGVWVIKRSA